MTPKELARLPAMNMFAHPEHQARGAIVLIAASYARSFGVN